MLDDGGVDQPALHLPQVRGDNVDVKLGKLKDEVVFRDRKLCKLVGMRKVARKRARKCVHG